MASFNNLAAQYMSKVPGVASPNENMLAFDHVRRTQLAQQQAQQQMIQQALERKERLAQQNMAFRAAVAQAYATSKSPEAVDAISELMRNNPYGISTPIAAASMKSYLAQARLQEQEQEALRLEHESEIIRQKMESGIQERRQGLLRSPYIMPAEPPPSTDVSPIPEGAFGAPSLRLEGAFEPAAPPPAPEFTEPQREPGLFQFEGNWYRKTPRAAAQGGGGIRIVGTENTGWHVLNQEGDVIREFPPGLQLIKRNVYNALGRTQSQEIILVDPATRTEYKTNVFVPFEEWAAMEPPPFSMDQKVTDARNLFSGANVPLSSGGLLQNTPTNAPLPNVVDWNSLR
jgi:hypothetical protein